MKSSKPDQRLSIDKSSDHELEILKAVAQARQGRAGSTAKATSEFDAHRLKFAPKPSRFRIEAMKLRTERGRVSRVISHDWDFGRSLLDAFEIVAVSKRIEQGGLVLEKEMEADGLSRRKLKRGESKNSLRNLFNRVSSRWHNHHNHNQNDDDNHDVLLGNESD